MQRILRTDGTDAARDEVEGQVVGRFAIAAGFRDKFLRGGFPVREARVRQSTTVHEEEEGTAAGRDQHWREHPAGHGHILDRVGDRGMYTPEYAQERGRDEDNENTGEARNRTRAIMRVSQLI